MKNLLLPVLILLVLSTGLRAQETRNGAPNIFLDCQGWCDLQYLKTEITYLNFMRDRADADIFIQQTGITTGSGGTQFSLYFYGQKQFANQNDTLVFNIVPNAPENDVRNALKTNLERGLLPYLLKTALAERIRFSVETEAAGANGADQPVQDPWNFWTFSINGSMNLSGQQVAKSNSLYGNLNARRVTEKQKTNLFAGINYNRSTFDFGDGEPEVYENGGYDLGASQIYSINQHWSYGFFAGMRQNQYNNLKSSIYLKPGLEYNCFPYKDAAKRQLSLQYRAGPLHNRYFEETIFFHKDELLWTQSLQMGYNQVVKWGSFNVGAYTENYLHDWSLNELGIFGGFELNLFKGFRISLFGDFNVPRNQVELPRGGATKEEALLAIRQLKTSYSYYTYCSVSYTFGSIYSNVVNPRFDGGNGGFLF